MSRKRQRIDALARMATANPVWADELAAELGEAEIERARLRSVALATTPSQPIPAGDRAAVNFGREQSRRRGAFGVALAVVALAAVLVAGGWLGGSGGGRPEFAAAAVRVAQTNPRLLVTAPGWTVLRADQFQPEEGEVTFGKGGERLDMHWYPARLYGRYLRDRATEGVLGRGTLLGERTTTIGYGRGEYATMLSPQGRVFVELRGRLGDLREYEEILRTLQAVDVETWLGAMPPSVVRPESRGAVIEGLLRGAPLPPGFDASTLAAEDLTQSGDSLAVAVANEIACGWVESWIDARRAGEQTAAREAVEAMATSGRWPIVREAASPWFDNYEIVARQLQAGRLDRSPSVYEVVDGKRFGYGPAWRTVLGCQGVHRMAVRP